MQIRKSVEERAVFAVYGVLRTMVLGILILRLLQGEQGSVYLCVLTLWLFALPRVVEQRFSVRLPAVLEVSILCFVFASEMLGEIRGCYVRFPWWDTVLHGFSGFLTAAVGYSLAERCTPKGTGGSTVCFAVAAFCFSMTVGVLWEMLEWGVDCLFGLDMQKDAVICTISSVSLDPAGGNERYSLRNIADTVLIFRDGTRMSLGLGGYLDVGLHDTMGDLAVNLLGATFFGVAVCRKRGGGVVKHFIPQFMKENRREEQ